MDVLNGLISLVFENAVEQPTFVAMYAQLGQALAEQLPELVRSPLPFSFSPAHSLSWLTEPH